MCKDIDSFETDRLSFRGISLADADLIIKLRSDPEVYRFFKSPHKISFDEHINWYYNCYLSSNKRFDWICIEKSTGTRIGVFGIFIEDGKAEVNYILSPESQHNGYAYEGLNALLQYSIDKWSVHEIIAEIHKENTASISLVKKIGFDLISSNGLFTVYGYEV